MRKIKWWLGLPKCCSTAGIHHPSVMDIPTLSQIWTKAKLTLLSAISNCRDPLLAELQSSCLSHIPETPRRLQSLAKYSISLVTTKTLTNQCRKEFGNLRLKNWNVHLNKLVVQKKYLEAVELETENRVWNRIRAELPVGKLSLILSASSDTAGKWELTPSGLCVDANVQLSIISYRIAP